MRRPRYYPLLVGAALWFGLWLPPLRTILESSMAGHMVAQIGLLAVAGWYMGRGLPATLVQSVSSWNRHGITGVLFALLVLIFWWLPVSLDHALQSTEWEILKFITIPLGVGLPLSLSWPRLPSVVQSFISVNLISMAVVMGWIYSRAPVRLCNNYLFDQQTLVAYVMWAIAGAITGYLTVTTFAGGKWK